MIRPPDRTVRGARRQGYGSIEIVVSTLIVGLVVVGSLKLSGGVFRTWAVTQQRQDGQGLAAELLAEIMQQPYEDPNAPLFGVELGEGIVTRTVWDDVDDYHGWSSAPEDKSGNPLAGYESWNREVSVKRARLTDPTQTALSETGLKRIVVTVTDPDGKQTVMVGLRSRWGTLEQAPAADQTTHTWVGSKITMQSGDSVHSATQVLNHATD